MEAVRQREQYAEEFEYLSFGRCDERYIWGDELVNGRIMVYSGKQNKQNDICQKNNSSGAMLVLVDTYSQKLQRLVSVNVDNRSDIVYMEVNTFNSCWKFLKTSLYVGIERLKSQGDCRIERPSQILDLSPLCSKTKAAYIYKDRICYRAIEPSAEEKAIMARRQRLLDNQKNMFFFSADNVFAHDRLCPNVKSIPNDKFNASETLPEGLCLCPQCRRTSLLRKASLPNAKQIPLIDSMLGFYGINDVQLEHYVNRAGMRFHATRNDELSVECGEDRWIICVEEDGGLSLWHNNYIRLEGNRRQICDGFHRQRSCGSSMSKLLNCIAGYTWEKHLQAEAEQRRLAQLATAEKTAEVFSVRPLEVLVKWIRKAVEKLRKLLGIKR